jgi:hypothetical protein
LSKFAIRTLPLLGALLLAGVNPIHAQGVSAYFGLGSAFDSAATQGGCPSGQRPDPTVGPGGTCVPVSAMGGVFGVFGADFMIKPHLGFNGEYSFRFAQSHYFDTPTTTPPTPINIRPNFYDFNAVYQPTAGDRQVVPVIEAGIGGAKLSYYANPGAGTIFSGSQLVASSNHFQVHGAIGAKIYFHSDVFLKPQFDVRYVPHLTTEYGRNFVPEFTISIGYAFGRS